MERKLDWEREASMADEGGVSGAQVEQTDGDGFAALGGQARDRWEILARAGFWAVTGLVAGFAAGDWLMDKFRLSQGLE